MTKQTKDQLKKMAEDQTNCFPSMKNDNQNKTKDMATPRPWAIKTYPNNRVDSKTCIEGNGTRVALLKHTPHYGDVVANARLIVKAVNMHEELVRLLKEYDRQFDKFPVTVPFFRDIKEALKKAEAA